MKVEARGEPFASLHGTDKPNAVGKGNRSDWAGHPGADPLCATSDCVRLPTMGLFCPTCISGDPYAFHGSGDLLTDLDAREGRKRGGELLSLLSQQSQQGCMPFKMPNQALIKAPVLKSGSGAEVSERNSEDLDDASTDVCDSDLLDMSESDVSVSWIGSRNGNSMAGASRNSSLTRRKQPQQPLIRDDKDICHKKQHHFPQPDSSQVFVQNVSTEASKSDLYQIFGQFGRLIRVHLPLAGMPPQPKGFAFVDFEKREDAEKAIKSINGMAFKHQHLRVQWALPGRR